MARIAAFFAVAVFVCACIFSRRNFSEKSWHDEVNRSDRALLYAPNFRDGEYFNPWMPMKDKNILSVFEWKFSPKENSYTDEEKRYLPAVISDPVSRIRKMGNKNFILWIGHNSFLLRVDGQYWITDPIFSQRALLPKRVTQPGISLADLECLAPNINVLVTHNHYDHLDEGSVKNLSHNAKFFVPLGLKKYFESIGRKNVSELGWWQKIDVGRGTHLLCLPVQHWSKRISQPFNTTLWASYLLITPSLKIYIGGDSGYFIGYREFGKLFPDIDYALMPTTAYHPRWFMHYAHMDIGESIMAFKELNARYFIPTQWGTFQLGDEPPGYPIIDLKRKIKEFGLDSERFLIMDIGAISELKGN